MCVRILLVEMNKMDGIQVSNKTTTKKNHEEAASSFPQMEECIHYWQKYKPLCYYF